MLIVLPRISTPGTGKMDGHFLSCSGVLDFTVFLIFFLQTSYLFFKFLIFSSCFFSLNMAAMLIWAFVSSLLIALTFKLIVGKFASVICQCWCDDTFHLSFLCWMESKWTNATSFKIKRSSRFETDSPVWLFGSLLIFIYFIRYHFKAFLFFWMETYFLFVFSYRSLSFVPTLFCLCFGGCWYCKSRFVLCWFVLCWSR